MRSILEVGGATGHTARPCRPPVVTMAGRLVRHDFVEQRENADANADRDGQNRHLYHEKCCADADSDQNQCTQRHKWGRP
jgi:hypothetical protein